MRECIIEKRKNGCPSLKCAIPYERGLDIEYVPQKKLNAFSKNQRDALARKRLSFFRIMYYSGYAKLLRSTFKNTTCSC